MRVDLVDGEDCEGIHPEGIDPQPPPIDVEELLQWALSRFGKLPWLRDGWRELASNGGCTAVPKRKSHTTWTEAQALAGRSYKVGTGRPAVMTPGTDVTRVMEAIAGLGDPALSELVRINARSRRRPDWKQGIQPKRVAKEVLRLKINGRRNKRRRRIVQFVWTPCSPAAVEAARNEYSRWHAALTKLAARLADQEFESWRVSGFAAPEKPWEESS